MLRSKQQDFFQLVGQTNKYKSSGNVKKKILLVWEKKLSKNNPNELIAAPKSVLSLQLLHFDN